MRISIWQQYSSNHSGGFDLIAQFKTLEEADNAVSLIHSIISKIAQWYDENVDELDFYDHLRELGALVPTPVEEELAKKYGLSDWTCSVDWAIVEAYGRQADTGLSQYENLLFLSNPLDTYIGAQPFDELLEKLGAKFMVYAPEHHQMDVPTVNVTCKAETEAKAKDIVQNLNSSKTYSKDYAEPLIGLPDTDFKFSGLISSERLQIRCREIATVTGVTGKFPPRLIYAAEFLPKLVAYLKEQGCTDFELSVSASEHED